VQSRQSDPVVDRLDRLRHHRHKRDPLGRYIGLGDREHLRLFEYARNDDLGPHHLDDRRDLERRRHDLHRHRRALLVFGQRLPSGLQV